MKKRHATGLLFAALLLSAASAQAAVVYLKDGSRLQGTVVGATARDIQLYTPDGTLRISTDRIASIDYQGAAPPAAAPAPAQPPAPVYQPSQAPVHSRFTQPRRPEDLGKEEFSLDLGITGPLSDVDFHPIGGGSAANGDVGAALGAQFLHHTSERLAFGADLEWLNRSATDSFGLLSNADSNVSGDSLVLLGIMKAELIAHGEARPYLTVGLGFHRTSETVDATPLPGFAWSDTQTFETRRLVDDHATGAAGTARFGVDFHMFDPSFLTFEFGWTALAGATYHATGQGQALGVDGVSGPVHVLTVVGRWGWRF